MTVRFLLICEGSSDAALISHIQRSLIHCGVSEADGTASYRGRSISEKIRLGLQQYGAADLLFIHRDADNAGADARYTEIEKGVSGAGYRGDWVGIVPVRMMEAWLLVDEPAIRRVAGRPRATVPLDLPPPADLEGLADPKQRLREVLLSAGGPRGVRRRKRFIAGFAGFRRQLTESLPLGGPLDQVPAWARFRDDVATVVRAWQNR